MSNTVRYNAITIFTENQGFFRQINDFTKEVTNELISRKFFQRVSAFHSAAWKNEKFTLTEKKFRQIKVQRTLYGKVLTRSHSKISVKSTL